MTEERLTQLRLAAALGREVTLRSEELVCFLNRLRDAEISAADNNRASHRIDRALALAREGLALRDSDEEADPNDVTAFHAWAECAIERLVEILGARVKR